MKFKCYYCLAELESLKTDGDELCDGLVCQDCSEEIEQTLKRAREIEHLLTNHIRQT